MSYSPRTACLFNAVSVAMSAKVADVDGLDVDHMVTEATQVLDDGSPERAAILNFATDFELYQFDPEQLLSMGTTLHDALERALRPDPVDAGRRDIYG